MKHTSTEKTLVIRGKSFGKTAPMPVSFLRNPKISPIEKVVYAELLSYAWYNAECFITQRRIGLDLGISESTARRTLLKIKNLGLINWKQQGLRKPNIYTINDIPQELLNAEADQSPVVVPDQSPMPSKVNEYQVHNSVEKKKDYMSKKPLWREESLGAGSVEEKPSDNKEAPREFVASLKQSAPFPSFFLSVEQRNQAKENLKKQEGIICDIAERLGLGSFQKDRVSVTNCFNKEAHKNGDIHKSLILKPRKNMFECKSCGVWGDLFDLIQEVKGCGLNEALIFVDPRFRNPVKNYFKDHGLTHEQAKQYGLQQLRDKIRIKLQKGVKYRSFNSDGKYFYGKGSTAGLYKIGKGWEGGSGFLTEAEVDAISLSANWDLAVYPIWALPSVNTFRDEWVEDFASLKQIFLLFDNDEAGRKWTQPAIEKLGKARCCILNLPFGVKDVSEFFTKYTSLDFTVLWQRQLKQWGQDKKETDAKGMRAYAIG